MNETKSVKTPLHIWIVGVLSLLWNSMGVFDFVMTQTKNESYMGSFTPEQLEFFYGFPMWTIVCWALAVFGALIGSVLLLCRSKFAVPVFGISLVCMIATAIQNYGMANAISVTGTGGAIFTVVIFVFSALLLWYAIAMSKNGVLK